MAERQTDTHIYMYVRTYTYMCVCVLFIYFSENGNIFIHQQKVRAGCNIYNLQATALDHLRCFQKS